MLAATRRIRVSLGVALCLIAVAVGGGTPSSAAASAYLLPLPSGTHLQVTQGVGEGDHDSSNGLGYAWDFVLYRSASEFPVVAARGGRVIGFENNSTSHCGGAGEAPGLSCWYRANYVLIDHGDGTSALYLHLATGSLTVSVGQTVSQGQRLATADSTGWSTGTHLHFQVEQTPSDARVRSKVDGWWFTRTVPISFSDSSVLAKNPNGVPVSVPANPDGYVSGQGQGSEQAPGPIASPTSVGLPFDGAWYLTGGPHFDAASGGVKYALDFAPVEIVACPAGKILTNRLVVAAAAGRVSAVDDGSGALNSTHSVIEVTTDDGLTTGYMHLANIRVHLGDTVQEGSPLGNPSCQFPAGGSTTGIHLHFYLKRAGSPLPIAGTTIGGWLVSADSTNYDGQLTKDGQVRTADARRCSVAKPCGAVTNEMSVGSTAVPSVPGGTWIEPSAGSQLAASIHVAAHAYPGKTGDPAIEHVAFTAWWQGLGDKSAQWKTACTATKATSGDVFGCDFDPGDLGAPAGQLWLSFDVYDKAGNKNLSPNGERTIDWQVPIDIVSGDGWQTYQGDGYTIDYPGQPQVYPAQSNGFYTVSASYFLQGSTLDPDVVYMVEKIRFPSGMMGLLGSDPTPYLKQALSSYAGYSDGTLSSPTDVTIDGRSGIQITSKGTNDAVAIGQILIVGDDMYMILAGNYPSRASMDTATFFASFHLQ
jgi:murein DD-endopeptidase MepM/ murein hydrolase activator NlpD